MMARTRHPGTDRNVVPSVQASHRAGAQGTAPAPGPTAAGTSPSLRIVLQELDRSGSGSLEFWRVYWAAFPCLSDAELLRVARAVGPRGRPYLWALTAAAAQTGERA